MSVRYPKVGDLIEMKCLYEKTIHVGILYREIYSRGNDHPSFEVFWNTIPKSYVKGFGLSSINILNNRKNYRFWREGIEQ